MLAAPVEALPAAAPPQCLPQLPREPGALAAPLQDPREALPAEPVEAARRRPGAAREAEPLLQPAEAGERPAAEALSLLAA